MKVNVCKIQTGDTGEEKRKSLTIIGTLNSTRQNFALKSKSSLFLLALPHVVMSPIHKRLPPVNPAGSLPNASNTENDTIGVKRCLCLKPHKSLPPTQTQTHTYTHIHTHTHTHTHFWVLSHISDKPCRHLLIFNILLIYTNIPMSVTLGSIWRTNLTSVSLIYCLHLLSDLLSI